MKKFLSILLLLTIGISVNAASFDQDLFFKTVDDDGVAMAMALRTNGTWIVTNPYTSEVLDQGTYKTMPNPMYETDVNIDFYNSAGTYCGTGILHTTTGKMWWGYDWDPMRPNYR